MKIDLLFKEFFSCGILMMVGTKVKKLSAPQIQVVAERILIEETEISCEAQHVNLQNVFSELQVETASFQEQDIANIDAADLPSLPPGETNFYWYQTPLSSLRTLLDMARNPKECQNISQKDMQYIISCCDYTGYFPFAKKRKLAKTAIRILSYIAKNEWLLPPAAITAIKSELNQITSGNDLKTMQYTVLAISYIIHNEKINTQDDTVPNLQKAILKLKKRDRKEDREALMIAFSALTKLGYQLSLDDLQYIKNQLTDVQANISHAVYNDGKALNQAFKEGNGIALWRWTAFDELIKMKSMTKKGEALCEDQFLFCQRQWDETLNVKTRVKILYVLRHAVKNGQIVKQKQDLKQFFTVLKEALNHNENKIRYHAIITLNFLARQGFLIDHSITTKLQETETYTRLYALKALKAHCDNYSQSNHGTVLEDSAEWIELLSTLKLSDQLSAYVTYLEYLLKEDLHFLRGLLLNKRHAIEASMAILSAVKKNMLFDEAIFDDIHSLLTEQYPVEAQSNILLALSDMQKNQIIIPAFLITDISNMIRHAHYPLVNTALLFLGQCAFENLQPLLEKLLKDLNYLLDKREVARNASYLLATLVSHASDEIFHSKIKRLLQKSGKLLLDKNCDSDVRKNICIILLKVAKIQSNCLDTSLLFTLARAVNESTDLSMKSQILLTVGYLVDNETTIELPDQLFQFLAEGLVNNSEEWRNSSRYILSTYIKKKIQPFNDEKINCIAGYLSKQEAQMAACEILCALVERNELLTLNALIDISALLNSTMLEIRVYAANILSHSAALQTFPKQVMENLKIGLNDFSAIVIRYILKALIFLSDSDKSIKEMPQNSEELLASLVELVKYGVYRGSDINIQALAVLHNLSFHKYALSLSVFSDLIPLLASQNIKFRESIAQLLDQQMPSLALSISNQNSTSHEILQEIQKYIEDNTIVEHVLRMLKQAQDYGYILEESTLPHLAHFLKKHSDKSVRIMSFLLLRQHGPLTEAFQIILKQEEASMLLFSRTDSQGMVEKKQAIDILLACVRNEETLTRNSFDALSWCIQQLPNLKKNAVVVCSLAVQNGQSLPQELMDALEALLNNTATDKTLAFFTGKIISHLVLRDGIDIAQTTYSAIEKMFFDKKEIQKTYMSLRDVVEKRGLTVYSESTNIVVSDLLSEDIIDDSASTIVSADLDLEEHRNSDEESVEGRMPVSGKLKSVETMTETDSSSPEDTDSVEEPEVLLFFDPMKENEYRQMYMTELMEIFDEYDQYEIKYYMDGLLKKGWNFDFLYDFVHEEIITSTVEDVIYVLETAFLYDIKEAIFYNLLAEIPIKELPRALNDEFFNQPDIKKKNEKYETEKGPSRLIDEIKEEIIKSSKDFDHSNILELLENKTLTTIINRTYNIYVHENPLESKFNAPKYPIRLWSAQDIKAWSIHIKNTLYSETFLPEILAVIRRACSIYNEKEKYQPRYVQWLAVLLLLFREKNKGRFAQILTGEGKSLITTILVTVIALIKAASKEAIFVDVITSSPILAKRDAKKYRDFYALFGLNAASNEDQNYVSGIKECYKDNVHIVYGDARHFQFDILRHKYSNLKTRGNRQFGAVVVDEVDNLLIDETNKIAMLSTAIPGMNRLIPVLGSLWMHLKWLIYKISEDVKKDSDEDETEINVPLDILRKHLVKYLEKITHDSSFEDFIEIPAHLKKFVQIQSEQWIESTLIGYRNKKKCDYSIEINSFNKCVIVPVDYANTGMLQNNSSLSDGLQLILQFKHGLAVSAENLITNFLSNVALIQLYEGGMYGITGTLGSDESKKLLEKVYAIDFVNIPTYKPKRFTELPGEVLESDYWSLKVIDRTKREALKGRVVLLVCETIERAETFYEEMKKNYSSKNKIFLYSKGDSEQERFFDDLIPAGTIIVATNLAGRGTDLKMTTQAIEKGGLHVICTFLPDNKRVDDQIFGRAARKGESGSGEFILNEDDVFCKLNSIEDNVQDIKNKRNALEKKHLENTQFIELPKIEIKDTLFNRYLELLKYLETVDKEPDCYEKMLRSWGFPMTWAIFLQKDLIFAKRSAVEELWGLWLKENNLEFYNDEKATDKEKSIAVKKEAILTVFDAFEKDIIIRYKENTIVENPMHWINAGNGLVRKSNFWVNLFYQNNFLTLSKQFYETAIFKDAAYAYIAYYNRVYALIKTTQGDYRKAAIQHLKKLSERITGTLQLKMQVMEEMVGYIAQFSDKNYQSDLASQVHDDMEVLKILGESVHLCLNVIEKSRFLVNQKLRYDRHHCIYEKLDKEESFSVIAQEHPRAVSVELYRLNKQENAGTEYPILGVIEQFEKRYRRTQQVNVFFNSAELVIQGDVNIAIKKLLPINRKKKEEELQAKSEEKAIETSTAEEKTRIGTRENFNYAMEKLSNVAVSVASNISSVAGTAYKPIDKGVDFYYGYKKTEKLTVSLEIKDLVLPQIVTFLSKKEALEQNMLEQNRGMTIVIHNIHQRFFTLIKEEPQLASGMEFYRIDKNTKEYPTSINIIRCNLSEIETVPEFSEIRYYSPKEKDLEMLLAVLNEKMGTLPAEKQRLCLANMDIIFTNISQQYADHILQLPVKNVKLIFFGVERANLEPLIQLTDDQYNQAIFECADLTCEEAKELIKLAEKKDEGFIVNLRPMELELLKINSSPHWIGEYKSNGYDFFFDLSERNPLPWRAMLIVTVLGVLQIVAGFALMTFTTGFALNVGIGLITEGVADILRVATAFYTRNLNMNTYLLQKSISMVISLLTAGFATYQASAATTSREVMTNMADDVATTVLAIRASHQMAVAGNRVAIQLAENAVTTGVNATFSKVGEKISDWVRPDLIKKAKKIIQQEFASNEWPRIFNKIFATDYYLYNGKKKDFEERLQLAVKKSLNSIPFAVPGIQLADMDGIEQFSSAFKKEIRLIESELGQLSVIIWKKLHEEKPALKISQFMMNEMLVILRDKKIVSEEYRLNMVSLREHLSKNKRHDDPCAIFDVKNYQLDFVNLKNHELYKIILFETLLTYERMVSDDYVSQRKRFLNDMVGYLANFFESANNAVINTATGAGASLVNIGVSHYAQSSEKQLNAVADKSYKKSIHQYKKAKKNSENLNTAMASAAKQSDVDADVSLLVSNNKATTDNAVNNAGIDTPIASTDITDISMSSNVDSSNIISDNVADMADNLADLKTDTIIIDKVDSVSAPSVVPVELPNAPGDLTNVNNVDVMISDGNANDLMSKEAEKHHHRHHRRLNEKSHSDHHKPHKNFALGTSSSNSNPAITDLLNKKLKRHSQNNSGFSKPYKELRKQGYHGKHHNKHHNRLAKKRHHERREKWQQNAQEVSHTIQQSALTKDIVQCSAETIRGACLIFYMQELKRRQGKKVLQMATMVHQVSNETWSMEGDFLFEKKQLITILVSIILAEQESNEQFNSEEVENTKNRIDQKTVKIVKLMLKKTSSAFETFQERANVDLSERNDDIITLLKQALYDYRAIERRRNSMLTNINNELVKKLGELDINEGLKSFMGHVENGNYSECGKLLKDGHLGPSGYIAGTVFKSWFETQQANAAGTLQIKSLMMGIAKNVLDNQQKLCLAVVESMRERTKLLLVIAEMTERNTDKYLAREKECVLDPDIVKAALKKEIDLETLAIFTKDMQDRRALVKNLRDADTEIAGHLAEICRANGVESDLVENCCENSREIIDSIMKTLEYIVGKEENSLRIFYEQTRALISDLYSRATPKDSNAKSSTAGEAENLLENKKESPVTTQTAEDQIVAESFPISITTALYKLFELGYGFSVGFSVSSADGTLEISTISSPKSTDGTHPELEGALKTIREWGTKNNRGIRTFYDSENRSCVFRGQANTIQSLNNSLIKVKNQILLENSEEKSEEKAQQFCSVM